MQTLTQDPGFDSGNFDTVAFDNFEIDEDGLAVSAGLDTNISSPFTDLALGTRPEDINIDGAGSFDTYNPHVPEELIPVEYMIHLTWKFIHMQMIMKKMAMHLTLNTQVIQILTGTLTDFSYGDPNKECR